MEGHENILSQEELDALFEAVNEEEETQPTQPREEPEEKPKRVSWGVVSLPVLSKTGKVISSEEYEKMGEAATDVIKPIKDPSAVLFDLRRKLKENLPFLELLADLGGNRPQKGENLQIKTKDKGEVVGAFVGFYFDKESFVGGIVLEKEEESFSVEASNIGIDPKGSFQLTRK